MLTGGYSGGAPPQSVDLLDQLHLGIEAGTLDADALLGGYCAWLYQNSGNYESVARQTGLDRRTVKKYLPRSAFRHSGAQPNAAD